MNLIKKLYIYFYCKSNSQRYIAYLRELGIKIGDECIARGPRCSAIDISRPSLIEIGDYVDMNLNFTILTHDYATSVFLRTHKKFINSSGRVKIGNNIYFGKNCTILKGVTIGDNCIIGANSLINKSIPANSVAVGVPAKVICTLEEYYRKRCLESIEEAFDYARSIKERYGRLPVEADFEQEFSLFVSGNDAENHTTIPIKFQMAEVYNDWRKNHIARYENFDDFLAAADVK
jgi:acetyltransferase-like isoleucine patch superfamily enzyme